MGGTRGALRARGALLGLALALALSACGDDEPVDDTFPQPAQPAASPSPSPGDTSSPSPSPGPEQTGAAGQTYTVEPGDTLSEIANRFGTTVDMLVEENDLDDPDRIFPGQQLRIP